MKSNNSDILNNTLYKKPTCFKLPGEILRNLIRKAVENNPENSEKNIRFVLNSQKDYIKKIPTVTAALLPKAYDVNNERPKSKNISKSKFDTDSNLTKSNRIFQPLKYAKEFSLNNSPINFLLQGKTFRKICKDN